MIIRFDELIFEKPVVWNLKIGNDTNAQEIQIADCHSCGPGYWISIGNNLRSGVELYLRFRGSTAIGKNLRFASKNWFMNCTPNKECR